MISSTVQWLLRENNADPSAHLRTPCELAQQNSRSTATCTKAGAVRTWHDSTKDEFCIPARCGNARGTRLQAPQSWQSHQGSGFDQMLRLTKFPWVSSFLNPPNCANSKIPQPPMGMFLQEFDPKWCQFWAIVGGCVMLFWLENIPIVLPWLLPQTVWPFTFASSAFSSCKAVMNLVTNLSHPEKTGR